MQSDCDIVVFALALAVINGSLVESARGELMVPSEGIQHTAESQLRKRARTLLNLTLISII